MPTIEVCVMCAINAFMTSLPAPPSLPPPGIVTVMDAKNCMAQLDEKKQDDSVSEAVRQVALADIILLNKTDLVTAEQLEAAKKKIRYYIKKILDCIYKCVSMIFNFPCEH